MHQNPATSICDFKNFPGVTPPTPVKRGWGGEGEGVGKGRRMGDGEGKGGREGRRGRERRGRDLAPQ